VASDRRLNLAAWIGLAVAVTIIVAAIVIPAVTGWEVWANHFPPLHALWAPHVGLGTVPAIVIALLAVRYATGAAAQLSWDRLLISAFVAALLWSASLALVDGPSGLGAILESSYEYLPTARAITDVPAFLTEFISRIPLDSVDNWPTHVAGHPPGAVLFFWVLVQLGLGSWQAAGPVVLLIGSTTPVAVLITLRRLGAEQPARAAAPFVVLGPSAIWMAVSADGMFTAVAAWGLCCLACAATSQGWKSTAPWAIGAGLVLGYGVMLSYGYLLLGVLAVAILVAARNWRPLLWAIGAALGVVLSFAAGGFAWWEAYPVLVERYWDGIATRRPFGYWVWANFAALAISAGPLVGAAIAAVIANGRTARDWTAEHRVVVIVAGAAVLSVVLADLSQMSKGEVERIWLPFIPWMLVATAALPERWRRYGLIGQLGFALLVQHLLFTGW